MAEATVTKEALETLSRALTESTLERNAEKRISVFFVRELAKEFPSIKLEELGKIVKFLDKELASGKEKDYSELATAIIKIADADGALGKIIQRYIEMPERQFEQVINGCKNLEGMQLKFPDLLQALKDCYAFRPLRYKRLEKKDDSYTPTTHTDIEQVLEEQEKKGGIEGFKFSEPRFFFGKGRETL